MGRVSQCPACQTEVNPSASACPSCAVDLATCAWCIDVTTLRHVQPNGSWIPRRTRYACDRCGRIGSRCRTGSFGGYCNGLARDDRQLCAGCTKALVDFGKTSAAWTLVGLVVSWIRPKK